MKKFECDKCGSCCRSLKLNKLYKDLDRGDGTCKYLNMSDNKCTVYNNRPTICNINKAFNAYFSDIYTIEEYHKLNKISCKKLREELLDV